MTPRTTAAPRRQLAVMRHAKAESHAASDMQRALTTRGEEQAITAGAWLARTGFVPDHVLVSSAARTARTARIVAQAWPVEPLWDETPALYEASPDSLLSLVRSVPADTGSLLVVGHNPTVAQLAQLLDDGEGVRVDLAVGFPPSSVTVFEFAGEWLDLSFFGATVVASRTGDESWTP